MSLVVRLERGDDTGTDSGRGSWSWGRRRTCAGAKRSSAPVHGVDRPPHLEHSAIRGTSRGPGLSLCKSSLPLWTGNLEIYAKLPLRKRHLIKLCRNDQYWL